MTLNEAFENLDREKQDAIIKAALVEFSEHGYKRASTNNIVSAARIGKGMLFYYFKNKEELYRFLVDYTLTCCQDLVARAMAAKERDIVEKYRQINAFKMEMLLKYPEVFAFLTRLYTNPDEVMLTEEAKSGFERLNQMRGLALENVMTDVDTSLFRKDLPPERTIRHIKRSMDGYVDELVAKLHGVRLSELDMEPYLRDYNEYLEDLKTIFYQH